MFIIWVTNQEMARDFVEVCGWWARLFGIAAEAMGEVVLKDDNEDVLAYRIKLASGFEIIALPSRARVLRGQAGVGYPRRSRIP